MTWDTALPKLKTDPRFTHSPLSIGRRTQVFQAHVEQLRSKHLNNLTALFEANAPSLATAFSSLPPLLNSLPVTKLGLSMDQLEREFAKWQRDRTAQARKDFDGMLSENSFVE